MTIGSNRSRHSSQPHRPDEPVDDFDLEQRLAQLERRYAEASMRFRRARDEYHLLSLQPARLDAAIAAARERYEAARRSCESLRRDIDELESRLS